MTEDNLMNQASTPPLLPSVLVSLLSIAIRTYYHLVPCLRTVVCPVPLPSTIPPTMHMQSALTALSAGRYHVG